MTLNVVEIHRLFGRSTRSQQETKTSLQGGTTHGLLGEELNASPICESETFMDCGLGQENQQGKKPSLQVVVMHGMMGRESDASPFL